MLDPKEYAAAACDGKQRFGTRKMAAKIAQRPRRQFDHAKLQPYRCSICAGWHLGLSGGKLPEKASDIRQRKQFEARRVWQGKERLS